MTSCRFILQIVDIASELVDMMHQPHETEDHSSEYWFLAWRNVSKRVRIQGKEYAIVKNVSGMVQSQELVAVMGLSGSGKTTLLQVIAGRQSTGCTGELYINKQVHCLGKGNLHHDLRRYIGFVYQEDVFLTTLTVREHLNFVAQLRMSPAWTSKKKQAASESTLDLFYLSQCADTPIGLISGGEKKRCSVVSELFSSPKILILDEATSGLDSAGASSLISILRSLTRKRFSSATMMVDTDTEPFKMEQDLEVGGDYDTFHSTHMAIIMSIHQPSTRMFYTFDKIILLSEGTVVYYGSPLVCADYLQSVGFLMPTLMDKTSSNGVLLPYNPADFAIELLLSTEAQTANNQNIGDIQENSMEQKSSDQMTHGLAFKYYGWWPRYILADQFDNTHVNAEINQALLAEMTTDIQSSYQELPWCREMIILLQRSMKASQRSYVMQWMSLVELVVISILAGCTWLQMPLREKRVADVSGFLFFCTSYWFFARLFSGLLEFIPERAVLKKDQASGSYRLSSYFIAKFFGNLPIRILFPSVFMVAAYMLAIPVGSFEDSTDYAIVLLSIIGLIILTALAAEGLGELIGTLSCNIERSISLATLISLSTLIFGGFYVKNLPLFMRWLQYTSLLKYSFDAIVQVQFSRTHTIPCDGGIFIADCYGYSTISTDSIQDWLSVDELSTSTNILVLAISCCLFKAGSFVALFYQK